jgi:hypothetical protein
MLFFIIINYSVLSFGVWSKLWKSPLENSLNLVQNKKSGKGKGKKSKSFFLFFAFLLVMSVPVPVHSHL